LCLLQLIDRTGRIFFLLGFFKVIIVNLAHFLFHLIGLYKPLWCSWQFAVVSEKNLT
jgi:hypothetical protein